MPALKRIACVMTVAVGLACLLPASALASESAATSGGELFIVHDDAGNRSIVIGQSGTTVTVTGFTVSTSIGAGCLRVDSTTIECSAVTGDIHVTTGAGNDTIGTDPAHPVSNALVISSGSGNDVIGGGSGNDTVRTEIAHDLVIGASTITSSADGISASFGNVEKVHVVGNDGPNTVNAAQAQLDVQFDGHAGHDTFRVMTGGYEALNQDVDSGFDGGPGTDRIIVTSPISIYLSDTRLYAQTAGYGNNLTLASVGSATLTLTGMGGPYTVKAIGAGKFSGPVRITGSLGKDEIESGPGNDVIDTRGGGDRLLMYRAGSAKLDRSTITSDNYGFDVVSGIDTVQISGSPADDVIDARTTHLAVAIEGLAGNDRLFGSAFRYGGAIVGGPGDDLIVGMGGDEILHGNAGNDIIVGGGGGDMLIGSQGNDRLFGGPGYDLLSGDVGNDVLFAADGQADWSLACGAGRDRIEMDRFDPRPSSC